MLGSTAVRLDEDDLAMIDAALPVGAAQGDRYPTAFMDQLDSERSGATDAAATAEGPHLTAGPF